MLLRKIGVENFRQLRGEFYCSEGLNIIFGRNGQGKTNWMEAIYILATGSSFRTSKIQETIAFDKEIASIWGEVLQGYDIERFLQVFIEKKRRLFFVNGKRTSIENYLEEMHAIVFNADQLEIVRGAPEARRKFLDSSIVAIYPAFYKTLSDYNRCIKQKNALLEEAQKRELPKSYVAERIEPWNEQIIHLAYRIHKARIRYVELLNEILKEKLFAFGEEEVSLRYVSSLEGKGDLSNYESLMRERLDLRLEAEMAVGHSLVGVHRDDMEI
ncbi:MAG: DNA replication/repair protein RecF, partial [Pyrinomonadaceae bacterium]